MDSVTTSLPRPAARTLRRWFARPRRERQIGVQWVGESLAVAAVRHGASAVAIEHLRSVAAPAAQRHAVVRDLKAEGVFRGARVHLLLAPGQYDVHQVSAPSVPEADLHDALRWQLRGSLGFAPEEALLDYARAPRSGEAPTRNALLVVTAARSAVTEATAAFAACGVAVDAVDVPEFAQRNLAGRLPAGTEATDAWLSFDAGTFLLTVHCRGELAFARRMLVPNATLAADAGTDPAAHFVERVGLQVSRSLDLFERQSGLPPVAHLIVGPNEHATALARDIGDRAALRVTEAAATELLRDVAPADAMLLPALGAALRPADRP